MSTRRPRRWLWWLIAAAVVVVVLAVGGSWTVGRGSQVGYQVQEILVGQSHTAVGRGAAVTGQMVTTQNHGILELLLDFRHA